LVAAVLPSSLRVPVTVMAMLYSIVAYILGLLTRNPNLVLRTAALS